MTTAQYGLLMDILGGIVIFRWGLPQKPQETDAYVDPGPITKKQIKKIK